MALIVRADGPGARGKGVCFRDLLMPITEPDVVERKFHMISRLLYLSNSMEHVSEQLQDVQYNA